MCAKKNQEMKAHGEMDKKEREKLGASVNKKMFTVGRLQDNRQLLEQLQSRQNLIRKSQIMKNSDE